MSATRRALRAAVLLVALGSVSRRAHASEGEGQLAYVVLILPLLPSEGGVDLAVDRHSRTRGLVGWSWQIPLTTEWADFGSSKPSYPLSWQKRHRLAVGVDLLPTRSDVSWRGRLGYRYCYGDVFGGVGSTLDGRGLAFSPELGLKFLHMDRDYDADPKANDFSLHGIVRAQVASRGFETVTFMLGWNMY